jgi:hypothetical protein
MENKRKTLCKIFVKVRADHEIGGVTRPLFFCSEDGSPVLIDRVVDVRPAPALKAGGQGIRYACRVEGKELFLFNDRDDWFIESD